MSIFYRVNRAIGTTVVADHGFLITTHGQLDRDVHHVVCCQIVPFVVTDDVECLGPNKRLSE